MTRLRYDAIKVSLLDLPPWPPELTEQAKGFDLPLASQNIGQDSLIFRKQILLRQDSFRIRFLGITGGGGEFGRWIDQNVMLSNAYADSFDISVLLTDASEEVLAGLVEGIDLILWLNRGEPVVKEIGGVLALGLGDHGICLGRVEVSLPLATKPHLSRSDVLGWCDGKPYRHHPAREALLAKLSFWRNKPELRAYLWQVPEELSPEKHAEAQRRQTGHEADQYSDLEELHRDTPTDYAGSKRCME